MHKPSPCSQMPNISLFSFIFACRGEGLRLCVSLPQPGCCSWCLINHGALRLAFDFGRYPASGLLLSTPTPAAATGALFPHLKLMNSGEKAAVSAQCLSLPIKRGCQRQQKHLAACRRRERTSGSAGALGIGNALITAQRLPVKHK